MPQPKTLPLFYLFFNNRNWAVHTKKYQEGQPPDISTWKTRFRCALYKLPDINELNNMNVIEGDNPYRVYQFVKKGKSYSFFILAFCRVVHEPFKPQPHEMVKHTQFVGLPLKELIPEGYKCKQTFQKLLSTTWNIFVKCVKAPYNFENYANKRTNFQLFFTSTSYKLHELRKAFLKVNFVLCFYVFVPFHRKNLCNKIRETFSLLHFKIVQYFISNIRAQGIISISLGNAMKNR